MRRPWERLLIALVVLAVTLFAVQVRTVGIVAVNYAPGWNLVSGPDGSTLSGAAGSLYTMQPGDTAYESVAAASPLKTGVGYWAYFPGGGSLHATVDAPSYSVTPVAGQWLIVGNPSATQPAAVSGADAVDAYTPADGYSTALQIPAGQAAWVLADAAGDAVNVTPLQVTPTPAPPSSAALLPLLPAASASPAVSATATPAASAVRPSITASSANTPALPDALTSFQGLQSLALNAGDLPGYSVNKEQSIDEISQFTIANYDGSWLATNPVVSAPVVIEDSVVTNFTTSLASSLLAGLIKGFVTDSANSNASQPAVSGIGDEVQGVAYNWFTTQSHTKVEDDVVGFRRGRVVVVVITSSLPGAGAFQYTASLARIIDTRLIALPSTSVPADGTLRLTDSRNLADAGVASLIDERRISRAIMDAVRP